MAEAEIVLAVAVAATATATTRETETETASDIPSIPISEGAGSDVCSGGFDLGTSPTQERSSNSHQHDSEYATASDDDDDDDDEELEEDEEGDGESSSEDDDDDNIDDDDEEEEDDDDDVECNEEGGRSIGQSDKGELEAKKKVDEDRSNPQYIPKRGTFYEHDDRTADSEVVTDVNAPDGRTPQESIGIVGKSRVIQSGNVSQSSKVAKYRQPTSIVNHWSHDRFDSNEQAPKSRQELVTTYGYDIRTEETPPRARRRNYYGRGPSKYIRNWEDEQAYLKASNKGRKQLPKPSDFPALNERVPKLKKPIRGIREGKENHVDKRQAESKRPASENKVVNVIQRNSEEKRDRPDVKNKEKFKDNRRPNASTGRQPALLFTQKQRNGMVNSSQSSGNAAHKRNDSHYDRKSNQLQNTHPPSSNDQLKTSSKNTTHSKSAQPQSHNNQNESYKKSSDLSHLPSNLQQHQTMPIRQNVLPKVSNLSQRLQQVQSRNDPSHVGSVQMHSLASQNQLIGQKKQPTPVANVLLQQQPQQQVVQQIPEEQRGPKRYSIIRRSQHEAQHIGDQLQQLQIQQQQPQPILIPDQHLMQANLMQLYHQETLHGQMQALQVNQAPNQQKPTYASVAPTAQAPQQYGAPATGAAPGTYYVASSDAYVANAGGNPQAPQATQYAQQAQNYLPQPQTAVTPTALTYTSSPQNQQAVSGLSNAQYGPTGAVSTQSAPGGASQAPPNANQNYNFQNYNTVGGTTYFVPPAQATTRPVVLSLRRPTNAIPILPPSEKNTNSSRIVEAKDESKNKIASTTPQSSAPIGSAENIDHIIDNMFVQRPIFQPPQSAATQNRKSSSPSTVEINNTATTIEDKTISNDEATTVVSAAVLSDVVNTNDTQAGPIENSANQPVVVQE